ncbi:hypothetical protein Tco_0630282 [Tanacetum coccineum]
MEETLSKFMSESAKRHEETSNLIKEIRASMDAAIRNQGASIKTLKIQIRQMSKVLQERGFGRTSVSVMPLSTYLTLGLGELAHTKLTVELADRTMKYPKGIAENMLVDFAGLEDMDAYRDEGMGDVIFGEPFLREFRINAKRFDGMITIYNDNESDLAAKKSTKLVKYQSSGILCVIVVMLEYRRIYNTHPC